MSNIHPAKTKRPAVATKPLAAWANATATRAARFGSVIVGRPDVFKSGKPAKDDRSTSITGRSSAGDDRLWETSHGALSSLYSPPTLNNGCDSPACAGLVQRHRHMVRCSGRFAQSRGSDGLLPSRGSKRRRQECCQEDPEWIIRDCGSFTRLARNGGRASQQTRRDPSGHDGRCLGWASGK